MEGSSPKLPVVISLDYLDKETSGVKDSRQTDLAGNLLLENLKNNYRSENNL
jgi:hypothetical protein